MKTHLFLRCLCMYAMLFAISFPSVPLEAEAPIPMYKKEYSHQGKKAYGLYSEEQARAALPDAWKNVARLPQGFPDAVSASLKPAAIISSGAGHTFDISSPADAAILSRLKQDFQAGSRLAWYFKPREERYRKGPGLSGDEMLADVKAGRIPEDNKHVSFIYGYFTQNVSTYYRMYRISGDRYYVDEIVKYADSVEWLLENDPKQFLPLERRKTPPSDPVAAIPHEPAALANFWASVNAARLLLEIASARGDTPDAPDVQRARRYLNTVTRYTASQVYADYQDRALKRGEAPQPFTEGHRTRAIRKKFNLPRRAAQIIEYTPWNQTFFYFAVLTAKAEAMKHLQSIEKSKAYEAQITTYENIVRAAMHTFQTENICVVREGVPYLFHMHTPLRDKDSKIRLGFPMFGGEDTGHSGSGAWNLPYIWEAGTAYGVTPAILAGYTNTMVVTLNDDSLTHKNGRSWPRNHVDSPWYLAASGRKNFPSTGTKGRYYPMMSFAPDIVAANRPYLKKDKIWEEPDDLNRLYAGHLYRVWMSRR